MVVAEQLVHNWGKHSTVDSDDCIGNHYELAAEPAGIECCCKNIQDTVDTFDDVMQGSVNDASADVDCRHDNMAMLAEEVGKEIPHHSSAESRKQP